MRATTLNYTLEGTDAAFFDINSANGQLREGGGRAGPEHDYTVEVVASDGTASDEDHGDDQRGAEPRAGILGRGSLVHGA